MYDRHVQFVLNNDKPRKRKIKFSQTDISRRI